MEIRRARECVLSGKQFTSEDWEYIVHACNAYPKLVGCLKRLSDTGEVNFVQIDKLLSELEEEEDKWTVNAKTVNDALGTQDQIVRKRIIHTARFAAIACTGTLVQASMTFLTSS